MGHKRNEEHLSGGLFYITEKRGWSDRWKDVIEEDMFIPPK